VSVLKDSTLQEIMPSTCEVSWFSLFATVVCNSCTLQGTSGLVLKDSVCPAPLKYPGLH
jgi:hypothetical protein